MTNRILRDTLLYLMAVGFMVVIYIIDHNTRAGSAFGSVYTLVVLYAWLLPNKYSVIIAAIIVSILTIYVGTEKYYANPLKDAIIINRIGSIIAIWIAAMLALLAQRSYQELEKNLANLNLVVNARTEELNVRLIQAEVQQRVVEKQKLHLEALNKKMEIHAGRLAASENRFRQLLHNAPIGISIIDKNGTIDHANEAFQTIFSIAEEQNPHSRLVDYLTEEDRDRFQEFVNYFRGNAINRSNKTEFEGLVKGRKISLGISLSALEKENSEYLVAAITDITSRKKQERLERKNIQVLARNAELEHVTQLASHDLQEPLKTVEGFVNLFGLKYGDQLDTTARDYLSHIKRATIRMSTLIRYLLDYSQVGTAPSGEVDLNEIVKQVLLDLTALIENKSARIILKTLPILPNGNSVELSILYQNLINNALKFSRKGVPPQVVIGMISSEDGDNYYVKDNGVGFELRHNEKMFQMFQRLHSRAAFEGTGIGLAFCKKIISAHEGQIRADSQLDSGSVFWFTLSANDEILENLSVSDV